MARAKNSAKVTVLNPLDAFAFKGKNCLKEKIIIARMTTSLKDKQIT